jgi:hypothetical protein
MLGENVILRESSAGIRTPAMNSAWNPSPELKNPRQKLEEPGKEESGDRRAGGKED